MTTRTTIAATAALALALTGARPAPAQEPDTTRAHDECLCLRELRPPHFLPPARGLPSAAGRSFLGVRVEDVDERDVERLGLPEERGALVEEVLEGTAADSAGLRVGDVILRWDRDPVESVAELRRRVRETPPGREVVLSVFRDEGRREVPVVLGKREGPRAFVRLLPDEAEEGMEERMREHREEAMERMREHREHLREHRKHLRKPDLPGPFHLPFEGGWWTQRTRLGIRLLPLTDQLARHFGREDGSGALVASVAEGSPAARAGLQAGDVLVSVAGEEVEEPGDAARSLPEEGGRVKLRIVRDREERTLTVDLSGEEEPGDGSQTPRAPDPGLDPAR